MLRIRKIEEEKAMGELARVIRRVNVHEQNREKAIGARQSEMQNFSEKYRDDFRVDLYQIYDNYLERLDSEINQAKKGIESLQPELEKEQEKVKKARIKKRVLELVKEREVKKYQHELQKYQRKELAEINYLRTTNQHTGESSENKIYSGMEDKDRENDEEIEIESSGSSDDKSDKERDPVQEYLKQHGLDS